MTLELFPPPTDVTREPLETGAVVLRRFALSKERELLAKLTDILEQAPLRHMTTPGGFLMSVAMTNCGTFGWVSDAQGYRYSRLDPRSGRPWPVMPEAFQLLAASAASAAGFRDFRPDACLINRYAPGTRLTLHQDRNERDLNAPIVSVSLGLPAVFLFGGDERTDPTRRIALGHGDVVVWGGPARMRYHGVLPLKQGHHPLVGYSRLNLTFRQAG